MGLFWDPDKPSRVSPAEEARDRAEREKAFAAANAKAFAAAKKTPVGITADGEVVYRLDEPVVFLRHNFYGAPDKQELREGLLFVGESGQLAPMGLIWSDFETSTEHGVAPIEVSRPTSPGEAAWDVLRSIFADDWAEDYVASRGYSSLEAEDEAWAQMYDSICALFAGECSGFSRSQAREIRKEFDRWVEENVKF